MPPEQRFTRGLGRQGKVVPGKVGRDLKIESRQVGGDIDRLRRYATELVALAPDVIVSIGSVSVGAVQQATRTIPIVFVNVPDPDQFTTANQTAKSLNLQVQAVKLEIPTYDFGGAFQAAAAGGAQLMMVLSSPAFSKRRTELAELAVKHRLPTMFTFKHYVDGGGLMSYGVEFPPLWRRVADYVARILKGAKPAELPIEQPTKFELVVNLKTAKALGITIPNGILLAADEVIE